ncbi:hypothetical protein D2E61_11955 [Mycobacteroides abscessus]|nr:hypothetical protein D2E61_11955 [Mycobacteroides abscessus]
MYVPPSGHHRITRLRAARNQRFALARTDFDGEPSGLPETDHRMAARSLVVCRAATAAVAVPGRIVEAILL